MDAIREKIWDGTIPVQISLAENEARRFESHVYYQVLPRTSYFPVHLTPVLKYFQPYLNDPNTALDTSKWWLEFENVPIRWNWPVGLSYDLLTGNNPDEGIELTSTSLPWALTLHYKEYPKTYLLAYEGLDTLRSYWLNQLKEADCMRSGNAKAVMSLSTEDTNKLWESVKGDKFNTFWNIMDHLITDITKSVPVKIYLPVSYRVLQAKVRPKVETSQTPQTVGTALHSNLPDLFPSRRTCIFARPMVHGVIIPMSTPLEELYRGAMYRDGFLHISIIMMT